MVNSLSSSFKGSARKLAELMSLETRPLMEWSLPELPGILKHQWSAPLYPDLLQIDAELAKRWEAHLKKGLGICFAEVLQDPHAPLEALQILMDFAKASWIHAHRPMPQAIAQVMYYACMAGAWLRHQQLIGGLDVRYVSRGFEWAMALPWLDEPTRQLFKKAHQSLIKSLPDSPIEAEKPTEGVARS